MELGCFDEDIFDAPHCKSTKPPPTYRAKICENKWFFDVKEVDEQKDKFHAEKCQADWYYYKGQFKEAQVIYEKLKECAPRNNPSLLKEMIEGTARCMMKQGQWSDAQALVYQMLESQPEDGCLWLLASQIYWKLGNTKGQIECLQKCATLNSWNQQLWHSLAVAYEKAEGLAALVPKHESNTESEEDTGHCRSLQQSQSHFYSYCCLLKAKFLIEKSLEKSVSLTRPKNQELLLKVDRKLIGAHAGCQCAKQKTQVQKHFLSLGGVAQCEEMKWKANLQQTSVEFELFWFGPTKPIADPHPAPK